MFWEKFLDLCAKNSTSPSAVCKALGFSNATATHWKNGAQPNPATLKKIANFFGVSVDYLLGKEDKNKKSPSGIPEELLEALASDPVKLELAKIICSWDSEKVDRAMQLLSASLLLPKEDPKP